MKTLFRYRRLTFLITMSMIVLLAITAALLSPPIYHNPVGLVHAKNWLDNSQLAFLCWRLALLAVIFISWPWIIQYKAKRHNLPVVNIQKAVRLRYYLVVFLLLLDVLLQWGQT